MRIVLCNCPPADADRIASTLVEERRAACVTALAGKSTYRWQGALCVEPEVTLMIKVASAGVDALRTRLSALHPYDVPEIVVVPVEVERSLPRYVEWVRNESSGENSEGAR